MSHQHPHPPQASGAVFTAFDSMQPSDYERRVCGQNVTALTLVRGGWVPVGDDGHAGMPAESAATVRLIGPLVPGTVVWGLLSGTFARGGQVVHSIRAVAQTEVCKSAMLALENAVRSVSMKGAA